MCLVSKTQAVMLPQQMVVGYYSNKRAGGSVQIEKRQKKGFLEDSIDWLVEKVIWSTLRNFLIGANQKNEIITYQQFWSLWVLSNDNRIHRG